MSSDSFSAISHTTRFRPTRKLPGRKVADETVVVDPQRRKVFSLNAVGAAVWSAVERSQSEAQIVAAIVRDFRVDEPEARRDVDAFLGRLEALGLATREQEAP